MPYLERDISQIFEEVLDMFSGKEFDFEISCRCLPVPTKNHWYRATYCLNCKSLRNNHIIAFKKQRGVFERSIEAIQRRRQMGVSRVPRREKSRLGGSMDVSKHGRHRLKDKFHKVEHGGDEETQV